MIIYEVRSDQGDGTDVEWFRNKAQAEKRKRELLSDDYSVFNLTVSAEDIVKHVIEPNKADVVRFLNNHASRDNG